MKSYCCNADFEEIVPGTTESVCSECGMSYAAQECDRLRAELTDAATLRQAEIESRNREIASLRAELSHKDAIINGLITWQSNLCHDLAAAKAEVERRGNLITALSACLEDTLDRARFMGDEETERVIREASEVYAADAAGRGEGKGNA